MGLASFAGTILGQQWVEFEKPDFDAIGPDTTAPAGRIHEIAIRSSDQDLILRLGGMAGTAATGWLGRVIFERRMRHLASRRHLEGAVITYGAASVRLGFHGKGDMAISSGGTYEVDLAYEPVPGTPRTMPQVLAAIAAELTANSATASTFNGSSKAADELLIFDPVGPQPLTVDRARDGLAAQPLTAFGAISLAAATDLPFTLDLTEAGPVDVFSLRTDNAGGATVRIEVR